MSKDSYKKSLVILIVLGFAGLITAGSVSTTNTNLDGVMSAQGFYADGGSTFAKFTVAGGVTFLDGGQLITTATIFGPSIHASASILTLNETVTGFLDGGIVNAGKLSVAGNNPVAPVTSTTTQQGIEMGTKALTSGTASVTFSPAFASGTPVCTCTDTNVSTATVVGCSANNSALSIKGSGTDSINWICIGIK